MIMDKFDEPLEVLIERDLMRQYGPMMSNDDLRQALGYASKDAFKQAIARKTVPITVFNIEGRRGKFALVKDVAAWIVAQRERALSEAQQPGAAPTDSGASLLPNDNGGVQ